MVTGPEHYTAAEQLLSAVSYQRSETDVRLPAHLEQLAPLLVARAQVHATLALAAATALRVEYPEYTHSDDAGWAAVAGTGGPLPRNTGLIWWLDDGAESPEPDLYASYYDASRAGLKQWKDANPTTTVRVQQWREAEDNGAPADVQLGDMELVINDQQTGIFLRVRRPKAID